MRRSVEAILRITQVFLRTPAHRPLQDGQRLFVMTKSPSPSPMLGSPSPKKKAADSVPSSPSRVGDVVDRHGAAPLPAPYDGILLFPAKVPEMWKVGVLFGFLAREGTS